MPTRRATDDSVFHQERYMSSAENPRGLLANCVAARVKALDNPLHRKLVWWLQKLSWQPGGLDRIAEEMIQRWPERFVTPSMERLGCDEKRIYNQDEVRVVRKELGGGFPLRGEYDEWGSADCRPVYDEWGTVDREKTRKQRLRRAKMLREARSHPRSYPASAFMKECRETAVRHLKAFLFEELCLNPAVKLDEGTLWYLPRLVETLSDLHDLQATAAMAGAPVTEIGGNVHGTLDYALSERCMVVIEGLARTGKTFSAEQWCEAHPGQARYVQVPSASDEISFYRAICASLGLGASTAFKANELRSRIESVLQTGDMLLCFDEGWALWPQRNMRIAMPNRINWVLTQLVNKKVPVAIVTTPQFTKSQEAVVRQGGWSSEQLIGRIDLYTKLADSLSETDLEAVARHWLPRGCEKSIRVLVTYAQSSEKYLQAITSLARRARFVAREAGRSEPTFHDVTAALRDGIVPSDRSLATAMASAQLGGEKRTLSKPTALPLQRVCNAPAKPPGRTNRAEPDFAPPGRMVSPLETVN